MGLVKQVVSALTKRKIMQLTHTYITLPLSGEPDIPACAAYRLLVPLLAVCPCLALPAKITACSLHVHACVNSAHLRVQISPTRWDSRTPTMPKATS